MLSRAHRLLRFTGHIREAFAVLAIVAAAATHKLALALVLLLGLPALIAALADRARLRGRRLLYAMLAYVGLLVAVLAIIGGLGHARGALSEHARWALPALAVGDAEIITLGREPLLAILAAVLAAFVLAANWGPRRPRSARAVAWTLVILALGIGLPWLAVDDPQSLGFRLRIVGFVPLALLAAVVVGALARVRPRGRRWIISAVQLAIALGIMAAPMRRDHGRVTAHPAMIASVSALAGEIPAGDTVIIPERHIMFMAEWYARVPAQLTPRGVPPERRWRALTLAFIRPDSVLDQEITRARGERPAGMPAPRGLHPNHPNGFVLLREDLWTWIVDRLPPDERSRALAWPTI